MYTGSKCQLKRHRMGQCMALGLRDSSYFRFSKDLGDSMLSSICCESGFLGKKIKLLCYFFPQKSVFVYQEGEIKNLWNWKWGGQTRGILEVRLVSITLPTVWRGSGSDLASFPPKSGLSKSWEKRILLESLYFSSGTPFGFQITTGKCEAKNKAAYNLSFGKAQSWHLLAVIKTQH